MPGYITTCFGDRTSARKTSARADNSQTDECQTRQLPDQTTTRPDKCQQDNCQARQVPGGQVPGRGTCPTGTCQGVTCLLATFSHLNFQIAWDCLIGARIGLASSSTRDTSVKSTKHQSVIDGQTPGPIDQTPGIPGSDKK